MEENLSLNTILLLVEKYTKELLIAGLVVAGIGYGAYYYHQSRTAKVQAGSSSLLETFEELERAYSTTGDWKEVEIAAKTGFQAHKGSLLASYFLVVQAQALAQQGNASEAVALLDTAIAQLSADFSLRYLFQTTQAQIKLDSQEQALKEHAVEQLTTLSQDSNNIFRDKALYYLMEHYKAQGNAEKADALAVQLQKFVSSDKEPSPWAQAAKTDQS